ncbi:MAG: BamA/TamA family outer membrane protein [Saprospirales bacterium]|nr:BamA/TamA family outer membrane protein [Saprospirales bacterium]
MQRTTAGFRGALGWAIPFGFSSGVPYVKRFYVGGPQSVRAWNARRSVPEDIWTP